MIKPLPEKEKSKDFWLFTPRVSIPPSCQITAKGRACHVIFLHIFIYSIIMNLKVWILKMLEYNKDKCRKKKQMNDVAALPRIAQKWCQNFPSVGAATLNFWNHLSLDSCASRWSGCAQITPTLPLDVTAKTPALHCFRSYICWLVYLDWQLVKLM